MSKEFLEAVCAGEIEKVKVLVAAEPGLVNTKNEQSQSAVLLAVYNGRKEIRDFLIASGATLALHEAAATGQLAGVKELVAFQSLDALYLTGTKVTDASVKELKGLKNLTELNLLDTEMTGVGLKEHQKALPKCKISG